jgi:predicted O-methyltransferase YrrM
MLQFHDIKNVLSGLSEAKASMSKDTSPLVNPKFGPPGPYDTKELSIAEVVKPSQAIGVQLNLFMLTLMNRPKRILDLGTSAGVSSAYLAAAQKCADLDGKVTTVDASAHRQRVAQAMHKRLGLDNINYKTGLFSEVLPEHLAESGPFDFALVDGDHAKRPILALYEMLISSAAPNALLIFTDIIGRNEEVTQAWRTIRKDERSHAVLEQGTLGIVYCFDRAAGKPSSDLAVNNITIPKRLRD